MKFRQRIRSDGEETKKKIITCAGRLMAEKGFAAVTSKEICESAGVNNAAVNYHFGSRDGLHLAVLSYVQNYIISLETLRNLYEGPYTAERKIEIIVDFLVDTAFHKKDWPVTVWMREMMNPSNMLRQVLRETGLPKFSIITHLFAEYTGYAMDDPMLYSIMLTLMSPFALALLGSYHGLQKESPLQIPGEVMAENLKKLTLAHLKHLKNIG